MAGRFSSISASSPLLCARTLRLASSSEKAGFSASQGPNGSSLVIRMSGRTAVMEFCNLLHCSSSVVRSSGHSTKPLRMSSPYSGAIFGLYIQFIAWPHLEGLVPCFAVAHGVTAIFSRSMAIGFELPAQSGFALELSPSLPECQEKTLFAVQPIDRHIRLAFE